MTCGWNKMRNCKGWVPQGKIGHHDLKWFKYKQVSQSALCRAVQGGFLAWVAQFHAVLHPASRACHPHIMQMTQEGDFIGDFGWQMTYVIWNVIRTLSAGRYVVCMTSAGMYVIRMSSAGTYVIHTSSAEFLMVSMDLNYFSTVTGTGYWMEFVATMLSCFISGSCKWFAT